ncbi:MAG: hypothetical protein ACK4PI_07975 [Tepidisphaerales bacterium]
MPHSDEHTAPHAHPGRRQRSFLWALLVLNVLLAAALLARYGKQSTAVAQVGRPSDYLMVPGSVVGSTDSVIYILDLTNGLLGAMSFNSTQGSFDVLQPIELGRLLDAAAQSGGGVAPGARPRR